MNILTAITLFLITLLSAPALATPRQDVIAGPLTARVLDVLDGDTVNVRIKVWMGQDIETSVRIAGMDAPEIHGKCTREQVMAKEAKDELAQLLAGGEIKIFDARLEKYAGRVVARAETVGGIKIREHMIEKGLARAYKGKKRAPWC